MLPFQINANTAVEASMLRLWFDNLMRKTGKQYSLPIEQYAEVDKLTIKTWRLPNASNYETTYITDETIVSSVINFFISHKSNWLRPWDTVPVGQFSITLINKNGDGQTFFVSGAVIVTFDQDGKHLWRFIESKDYYELICFLDLDID